MRRSNFALRLQPSLLEELRKAAELEGAVLNKLINVAVAEKVSALRTQNTICLVSCLAEEQGRLSRRCYAQYRARLRRSPTLRSRLLRHTHSILIAPSVRALEHCRARESVQKPPARIGRYERRACVGKARCEFRKFWATQ